MEREDTLMGVAAREGALLAAGSAKLASRKPWAERSWASEASQAAREACRAGVVMGSRRCGERVRKRRSRESWVRPRWVREPRMVWLWRGVSRSLFICQ
jgi:hypothetical protein